MRVSEYFGLQRSQPELDFVDVDLDSDLPVFVDPRALRLFDTEWGNECVHLIQHFFQTVLDAIRSAQSDHAIALLSSLREPNETRLGFSTGRPRGRGMGRESARDLWTALGRSEAVRTGLLEDLEDTILTVEGIGPDIVSDIATNVVRESLINYTQVMATAYEIPLTTGVDSGALWDPQAGGWAQRFTALPIADSRKLLLVPKAIVRRRMDFDVGEYYRHYLLPALQEIELSDATSDLVHLLKSGEPRVYKADLERKYGTGKRATIDLTMQHPDVLDTYRSAKSTPSPPLGHDDIADLEGTERPNLDGLLSTVRAIPAGAADADSYHRSVESLLSALLYPALAFPQLEHEIHQGRKRIDITYTNVSTTGFFHWLADHYPAPHIFVECKNYSRDPANPELDQLAGRFSPRRGKFGLLVCRSIADKDRFRARCRDTADDDRGYIVALDDDDLVDLVEYVKTTDRQYWWFKQRFDDLID
ncbi:MAG: hypothetical protein AB7L91_11375 [Dehalococcoidia bacterium]